MFTMNFIIIKNVLKNGTQKVTMCEEYKDELNKGLPE